MAVFEVRPVSLPNGDFSTAWFDDERLLWKDDRLKTFHSLAGNWNSPKLLLHRPERGATAVLFNPNGFAVSEKVRDALASFPEIEFLPVEIADHGIFFMLHVVACYVPPDGCSLRKSPISRNIVELLAFPAEYEPKLDFFRVLQPQDSAAGPGGHCLRAVYASARGAQAIESACRGYLEAPRMGRA